MAYIFGGSTGETADSLKRKRAYVQAMLESAIGQSPDNIGDGIAVIGRALAGRLGQAVLNKREKEGTAAAMKAAGGNSYIRDLLLGGGGGADISGTGGSDYMPAGEGKDYFSNIKSAESGGNPNAKNPKSSATGLYQFTDGTWANVARLHPELGLTPDGRRDPRQQEAAIRAFTADNARSLASAGIEPTGGNLYAAHFLGAGGARNVLTQPDSAPVAAIVGQGVVKANPFLARMTVGDFKRWAASKGGNDTLAGGEGDDQLRDTWGQPDPQRFGHGINTQTGAPASFSQPDPARYGGPANMPAVAMPSYAPNADPSRFGGPFPKSDRLPQPQMAQPDPARFGPPAANGMPQFNPMMAQGPLGPQSLPPDRPMPSGPMPQPQMAQPAPTPQPRPQMAPQVDPMQTAAIQQQMRPRGIVSPRAEDNGYTRGPGAAPQNMMPGQGGQGGGLLARLLMRQPMPQPAQGKPVAGGGGAATAPGGGNDDLMEMYALIDNPYLPESYRAALVEALKQKQMQGDPAYQLDMDLKRAQLEKARAPEPAPETYRTLTDEEEKKYGLDPANAYQMGADNKISQIGGGGVNVNVGDVKTPAGYRPIDPTNPGAGVEPIRGGPAEQIAAETAARLGMAEGFIENFPEIEKAVKEGGLTGIVDRGMVAVGRGAPGELDRKIRSGTDALQRMLTGAGMPASEAAQYAARYLPGLMDDSSTALSKLRQLKYDLEHAGEVVGRGRGGSPISSPGGAVEDPLGIR